MKDAALEKSWTKFRKLWTNEFQKKFSWRQADVLEMRKDVESKKRKRQALSILSKILVEAKDWPIEVLRTMWMDLETKKTIRYTLRITAPVS
jgi:hypothetical protein